MENINFIPAHELPETEAAEVEVLCLDNGQLKRKPAANLGGGNYDVKIRITYEPDEDGVLNPVGELLEGSFEAAKQKMDNDRPATALVIEDGTAFVGIGNGPFKAVLESSLAEVYDYESLESANITGFGFNVQFAIFPDGTIQCFN